MDTKLRSSRKHGIIVTVIFLSICSLIMLSQYDGISRYLNNIPEAESVSFRTVLLNTEIGRDLAQGNYLLYNQYTGETDPAQVLELYGQTKFELTDKYLDTGLFDSSGNRISLDHQVSETETEDPLYSGTEETAGYVFRARYTFSEKGQLISIQIDGTELSPEDEYELESAFLTHAQNVACEGEISSISTPENITFIYGMNADNMELFMDENAWVEPVYTAIEHTGYYRDTLEGLWIAVILAALLLPLSKKLDISAMKIFDVPFEIVLLVWFITYTACLGGPPVWITEMTVKGTLLPGMNTGNGIWLIAMAFNFYMWFILLGLFFWSVTSLRAIVRMKGGYWRDRTLIMKLIRHFRGQGTASDEEMARKAGGIVRCIKNFFAAQYDSLQHIDFREKTNRTILKIVIINYIILAIVCFLWYYGTLALIIYSVLLFLFLRKYVKDLQSKYKILLRSTSQLAEGHLDTAIDGDVGIFKPIQDELQKIQKGFKKAVDEEVKNERMKTELVTNVSHDLRTPLTAIITYTDLLKNENNSKKQKEYIDVLEKKSLRLKVLIEDLFEISKAASKSVVMNYMQVDIVDLIKQAGLENDEKIKAAGLDFRWTLSDHKLIMWLDSQKTYRIFENLIVNITKYALPHTRVYIEMTETEHEVCISMKNISAAELNFNTDEITDRFVRGDVSRNTEGSGLGLAIAKSFIELQRGTLEISTEADLFKADIVLPKLPAPEEKTQK